MKLQNVLGFRYGTIQMFNYFLSLHISVLLSCVLASVSDGLSQQVGENDPRLSRAFELKIQEPYPLWLSMLMLDIGLVFSLDYLLNPELIILPRKIKSSDCLPSL